MVIPMLFILFIAGCSTGTEQGSGGESQNPDSGGDTEGVSITFSAGTEADDDSLYYETLHYLAEELSNRTDGRVTVDIYPNEQLGNEVSMIEGLRQGSVDIAVAGGANFAGFVPEFQLFSVPYIFEDYEVYRQAMDPSSDVWKLMQERVLDEDLGLQLMAPTTVGSRWIANTKGEVSSPKDIEELKLSMRIQANPIESEVWSSYGASPVNMPMPEVFSAMKQGVVDAVENAPDILYTQNLHEVAQYFSETDHSFYVAVVLMSDAAWEKIPEDLQPIVIEVFEDAGQHVLDVSREFHEKAVEGLKEGGAIVTQVDKEAFREPLIELYDKVAKDVEAEDLLEAIRGLE